MNYNVSNLHLLVEWIEENYSDSVILLNILEDPKIYYFTNFTFKKHVDYIIKSLIEYKFDKKIYDEFLLQDSILNKHRNITGIL